METCCMNPNCLNNVNKFDSHDTCASCQHNVECNKSDFKPSASIIKDYILQNKTEFDEDVTEDEAIVDLMHLHDIGCLVEYSSNCRNCPKFGKCCPI